MKAKKSASKRVNPEPGVHVARLIHVIDWGSQIDKYSDENGRPKLELVWELPQCLHVFNEDKGEQPLVVSRKYGNTLGRGSELKKAIESMLGQKIDNDFELDSLKGELCMLNISIEPDGEYENVAIQSLMPLTKDLAKKKFPEFNEQFVFDLDNFDQDIFDSLPEFKKEKISATKEYAEATANLKPKATNGKAVANSKAPAAASKSPFAKKEPAKAGAKGKGK